MGGSGGAGQNYVLSKLAIIVSIAPLKNCNTMIFVVLIVIASCLLPFPSLLGTTGASAIGRRNRVRGDPAASPPSLATSSALEEEREGEMSTGVHFSLDRYRSRRS